MVCPVAAERRAVFNPDYVRFHDAPAVVSMVETHDGGAVTIDFAVAAPSIVVNGLAGGSLYWLKSQSCADGAIVLPCADGLHVHLVEMKRTVTAKKWRNIKGQLAGMLSNVRAALGLMGLGDAARVTCHVAFENDALAAAPVLTKAINTVGGVRPLSGSDWAIGRIDVLEFTDVAVNKIVWGGAATPISCT